MQFRHPEILYFLFLLVIPILVHLFQLRRFKKEYFTNVDFLKELSIQTRKSSKIKKWLLLATRLLLLAAAVIAFAQPYFRSPDKNNAANEIYIVLDNSFSMQAKGKKGELLKRAVEDLLQNIPEKQQFSLLTNNENYWNTDIKSVQKELQQLKYSAIKFDIAAQMAKITGRKSSFRKDVIVITDAVGMDLSKLKANSEINANFIIPEAEKKNNFSIDSVYLNQTLDNFYEIAVKVSAYGAAENEIPLALYNRNKLIAKTSATIGTEPKILKFTIPKEDFQGYAAISDNALDYDNKYFFSLSKPGKAKVISIGESKNSDFLTKIYTQAEFKYSNSLLSQLNYNAIEDQDAIILNEPDEIPQALQTTLKSFVEKGGNIVLIPAAKMGSANLNSFLADFGSVRFGKIQDNKKLVTKISFDHPLYAGVFEKKIENFQYPETKQSYKISGPAPTILGFEDQDAFLTATGNSVGSVYVFAAPLNKQNSNFQNSPLIVPTFYNMAHNVSSEGVTAITIGAGKPMIVATQLAKDAIVKVIGTESGESEGFIPVQQILSNKVRLDFSDLPQQAGNYTIFNNNESIRDISFNYDRSEGNLAAVNKNLPDGFQKSESVESLFDKLQATRTDNELWKLFVVLTLLFLVTEIFIQKFVK